MKKNTPVEELFELLWDTPQDKFTWYAIRNRMVKKEMAVIIEAFHEGMRCQGWDPNRGIAEEYYNETFNTKWNENSARLWRIRFQQAASYRPD